MGSNGLPLQDPVTGNDLSPARVLTNIVNGDHAYGNIKFANLGDGGDVATTEGVGLSLSLSGPYYQSVQITLDSTIWSTGQYSGINVDVSTLLHELGHAISFLAAGFGAQDSFKNDTFSDDASADNTRNVKSKCIN